jgi:hypothetical protein
MKHKLNKLFFVKFCRFWDGSAGGMCLVSAAPVAKEGKRIINESVDNLFKEYIKTNESISRSAFYTSASKMVKKACGRTDCCTTCEGNKPLKGNEDIMAKGEHQYLATVQRRTYNFFTSQLPKSLI